MPSIRENFLNVSGRVERACANSGRPRGSVRLLAVSKRWPARSVLEVYECEHRLFAESRLQEAEGKLPSLPGDIEWHFIGHIQKNKVRKLLQLFTTLHSIDSPGLAGRVDAVAAELGLRPKVFLQVNLAGEESKGGFSAACLRGQISELLRLKHLDVLGLMAIPPEVDHPEESRPHFRLVRELQAELATATGHEFSQLSMGMSGDFEVAIDEGATIVRVGTTIFGERNLEDREGDDGVAGFDL